MPDVTKKLFLVAFIVTFYYKILLTPSLNIHKGLL